MKYLKINNGIVEYTIDESEWKKIDEIDKDDLYKLISFAVDDDFQMDEFDRDKIQNQAHLIIYKNIYERFNNLLEEKSRFKDESEALFKEALEKYSSFTSDD